MRKKCMCISILVLLKYYKYYYIFHISTIEPLDEGFPSLIRFEFIIEDEGFLENALSEVRLDLTRAS